MRPFETSLLVAAMVALLVAACASPKPREVRQPETMLDIVTGESDYNRIVDRPSTFVLILSNKTGAALKEIVERGARVSEWHFVRENVAWGHTVKWRTTEYRLIQFEGGALYAHDRLEHKVYRINDSDVEDVRHLVK